MAIQRCPYCKAIIDEGAEYCTNCGTKLLFPEDEFIDEDIPGEKIIDVDEDISGIQEELKEETGEGASLEAELEDVVPIENVAPVEDEMAEHDDEEAPAEEKSETEQLVAAIEADLVDPEANEPEKKKAAPKKRTPSRKRKSRRKKPAAKKTKKEAPIKVVEDEEPEIPAGVEAASEEQELAAAELEPAAEEEGPEQAADELEPAGDAMEAEAPAEEDADLGTEPPELQEEMTEEEAEIRDIRRSLTEDLPDGFADVIDEARERSGDPLEEFVPQEINETLEEEEPVPEMLTPEPGT
ncbi:MAG: zinc ribbon domain-containing protein, partial [Candidatus Aminicenantaceae bacterium]